jgi:tetratricopeptide (TPR) repeat protein
VPVTAGLLRAGLSRSADEAHAASTRRCAARCAAVDCEHAILLDAAPQQSGRLRALRAAPWIPLPALSFNSRHGARPAEALSLLREAAGREPQDAEIQANLGWGAYALGLGAEALAALERAVELEGASPRVRMQLAFALRQVGEKQRALSLARAVLARQPGAPWADEGRALVGELEAELASRRQAERAS